MNTNARLLLVLIAIGGFFIGAAYMGKIRPIQEYQIRLESDSVYIYEGGRFVGSCEHGNDGIDSVIRKDNL